MLAGVWRILHHVTEMYCGGVLVDRNDNNKIFYFALICGEILFWCSARLINVVRGFAFGEFISPVIGILRIWDV